MNRLVLLLVILATVYGAPSIDDKETAAAKNSKPTYDDDSRIINGTDAHRGQFPFMCSLQCHGKHGYTKFCGCTIIDRYWALTAAHCIKTYVRGPEEKREDINCLNVVSGQSHVFGFLFASELKEPDTSQISPVSAIYIHQKYARHASYGYDIALLNLREPVQFNQYVQPIALAGPKFDPYNQWAFIMGWGQTEPTKQTFQMQVSYSFVPRRDECSEKYGWGQITEDQLCIHSDQSNICLGDSGGPLVHRDKNGKFIQTGINSYVANKTCVGGAVLTSVSHFIPWIRDVMIGNYGKYNITTENE